MLDDALDIYNKGTRAEPNLKGRLMGDFYKCIKGKFPTKTVTNNPKQGDIDDANEDEDTTNDY